MKRLIILLLLCHSVLWAGTTYYVKKGVGSDSNDGLSPSTAFATITKCRTKLTASSDNTCVVYGTPTIADGDYTAEAGNPYTVNAGSGVGSTGYNIVMANPGDDVKTREWLLNSNTKLVGLDVTDPSDPNHYKCANLNYSPTGATNVYITGNKFTSCGSTGGSMVGSGASSVANTVIFIQQNKFTYSCSTSSAPDVCYGINIHGDDILIEGNDFSHVQAPIAYNGHRIVIRNNTTHDIWGRDQAGNFASKPGWTGQYDCIVGFNTSPTATIDASGNVTWTGPTGPPRGDDFSQEYGHALPLGGSWVKVSSDGGSTYFSTKYPITSVDYTSAGCPVGGPSTSCKMTLGNWDQPGGVGVTAYTLKGGNGQNCHWDFAATEPPYSSPAQFILIQGDKTWNAFGHDTKGYLVQGDACTNGANPPQCYDAIIRFETMAHIGSGLIADNYSGTHPFGFINVSAYNNTYVDTCQEYVGIVAGCTVENFVDGASNSFSKNEVFDFPSGSVGSNPVSNDGDTNANSLPFTTGWSVATCDGNVNCLLYGKKYSTGHFAAASGGATGNVLVNSGANDMKFISYDPNGLGDLSILATSPAKEAGSYLTTVAVGDSGSGTDLVVDNCHPLYQGNTTLGIAGDGIRVGISSRTTITAINYTTCHATINPAISRSPGDGVYLASIDGTSVLGGAASPTAGAYTISFTLSVSKSGAGTGTVTSDVGAINCGATCSDSYLDGTVVTLTAVADGGSSFTGWTGAGCSGIGTCAVTLSSTNSVIAGFSTGTPAPVATLTCPGYAMQGNAYSCTFSATNCTSATLDGNAASCSGSQTFTAGLSGTTEAHAYIATGAGGSNESDASVKITPRVAATIMALVQKVIQ